METPQSSSSSSSESSFRELDDVFLQVYVKIWNFIYLFMEIHTNTNTIQKQKKFEIVFGWWMMILALRFE
jgi:hypothetical protein